MFLARTQLVSSLTKNNVLCLPFCEYNRRSINIKNQWIVSNLRHTSIANKKHYNTGEDWYLYNLLIIRMKVFLEKKIQPYVSDWNAKFDIYKFLQSISRILMHKTDNTQHKNTIFFLKYYCWYFDFMNDPAKVFNDNFNWLQSIYHLRVWLTGCLLKAFWAEQFTTDKSSWTEQQYYHHFTNTRIKFLCARKKSVINTKLHFKNWQDNLMITKPYLVKEALVHVTPLP